MADTEIVGTLDLTIRFHSKAQVEEFLAAIAQAQGKKLPKADSDEYRALLRKVAEAKADAIVAEATRRTDAQSLTLDIEL